MTAKFKVCDIRYIIIKMLIITVDLILSKYKSVGLEAVLSSAECSDLLK